jgi:leucyl-tRNA synthetase
VMWAALGGEDLWRAPWPQADPAFLERERVTVVVQVNGKLRDRLEVAPGTGQDAVVAAARGLPKVAQAIDGKRVVREIVVPDRLVNLVVK